jgi:hypothetical protein
MNFLSWLQILFIGLKLTGYLSWAWLWVLAPVWIPLSFWLSVMAIILVFKAGTK